ncbi:MAG: InlB B-repeat-containing protein, partial [Fibrobacter sp.]|nr:InlB B-repeat-containing protein [Fibrobacter sp.]
FSAWYDNAEHTGDAVTKIEKGAFGDKAFYALYTQDITVTIGEKTFPVTIVSDDDADDINEKILAEAHNQGIEDPTKTDPDGKITYEFEKYNCTAGVSGYSCENVFTKTYTEYTVSVVLPEGATLDCVEGHNGAVNCTDDGAGIKHTYGDETRPLPGAVKEGWEFAGWYDNADGIDDGVNNHLIDAIGASEFGEDIKIYALFAKELTVTLSTDPDVSVKIALDNNDNADSVSKKVNEAYGKLTPKPAAPTKDSDDKYDYTFKEFVCEGSAESYACSAKFTPTGREFKVAVNLPDSIWLVCKISNGCAKDASGKDYVKHNYGTETLLPEARIIDSDGEIIRDWEFKGWFENEDGLGDAVKTIDKEVAKDTTLYPFFTKEIKVSLDVTKPATVIDVVIDNNDNADSVSAKVTKAAAEHVPPIEPTPKHIEEAPKLIDFAGYECEFKTDAYVCKAVYDTTGMTYEVAVNLPDNAHLVCTEGAVGAENCTEDGSAIKHTYGTDTKPLPGAVMTDKLGEVDDSWNFVGWFDNKDGIDDASLPDDKGNKVESINAEAYGSDLEIFPYFEKVIHVVLSEDPLQEVDVAIDNNDDADSVSAKVTKAAEDNGFEKPKKDSDGKYDYFFSGYECTEVNDNYECEAGFDRTPIVFEVAVNLPANAKLICDAGAKGAENCAEYGTAIYHTYGIETTPLPDVAIVDGKGIVDESWKFEGWFDNKDGIDDGANGNKVTSIVADATNGESIYPYLTKTIVAKIGDETVEVVIDNNDTKDSINAKVTEAAENRNPPIPTPKKDKDDEYEYEFTGYECDADFVCEATFDGKPYDIDIVVAYGDGSDDTLEVTISSTDTDADIEKKIEDAMKNHVPEIPLPTKDEDAKYTYEFDKFEKNPQTGRFEPTFNSKAKIFQVSFNLPKSGKLTREFKGYVYGERTELPEARIENDGEWVFKGWYTKKNGAGVRVKVILETETGELSFYPLFQKTIKYDARGNKGEIIVIYEDDPTKTIERALNGVIPMDYQEKGKTYTFDKWVLKNGVYTATFTEKTSVIEVAKPSFGVNVSGHTLEINGAPMNARVAVFNMSGRMVAQGIVENGTQRVELTTPGSYVVRVNSQVVRVNVK